MPAQLIDGKRLAQATRETIAKDVTELYSQSGIRPGLAVFLVGDNPASAVYVRNKKKACDIAGFFVEDHALPATISQPDLLALIEKANADPRIHG
ncbi:MAG: bifunctional 5,10-methylene-tetrahydrofolate dehydrogenase/5,10-methylene-tetrahydrofolate cyclohydrolase, partial [Nitrospirae bacterium]|nr:bifunctional 5,10-methylene-tetrahydrofolate dehydrogenase/5,10-methylene-tetrahydrofolate cyclohydrolase [Nitrospirota bacterium]